MTPPAPPALPSLLLPVVFILLVPWAAVGLALINTGLGRSRSAAHTLLASLCLMAVAMVVYFICGFAWQGFSGRPGYEFLLAGRPWNWIAAEPWFFRGLSLDGSAASLAAWLGMFSAGLAALIPLGAAAERWRLRASVLSTILLAGWTYPWFAHWVWGGGWLAGLGVNYGLGHGFLDAGGSSTIQAVGGLTALALAWILGPRRGKYSLEGLPAALPGHNAVLVLFGCGLTLVGWLGLNGAGAILFYGVDPGQVVLVAVNTTLAAAAALLAAVALGGARFGRPDASLAANGLVGGLVASSAACAFVTPAAAVVIGLLAGLLVTLAVPWIELRLALDDPGGAVSVHAAGGIWGVVALGLFARPSRVLGTPAADHSQWLAQLVGVATLVGFVLPLTYGLNWLLDRFCRQRVAAEGERQGMDLYELGAGAYPEFSTHTDEFTGR